MLKSIASLATLLIAVAGLAVQSVRADVIDDALALSKKTGRPILAIYGSDT